ncbi:hypothetical protein ACJJTC_016797 [Scirpophaga incertulas]
METMEDKNINYFKEDVYGNLKELYDSTVANMKDLLQRLREKKSVFFDMSGMLEDNADQTLTALMERQQCNFKALDHVMSKIDINTVTESRLTLRNFNKAVCSDTITRSLLVEKLDIVGKNEKNIKLNVPQSLQKDGYLSHEDIRTTLKRREEHGSIQVSSDSDSIFSPFVSCLNEDLPKNILSPQLKSTSINANNAYRLYQEFMDEIPQIIRNTFKNLGHVMEPNVLQWECLNKHSNQINFDLSNESQLNFNSSMSSDVSVSNESSLTVYSPTLVPENILIPNYTPEYNYYPHKLND